MLLLKLFCYSCKLGLGYVYNNAMFINLIHIYNIVITDQIQLAFLLFVPSLRKFLFWIYKRDDFLQNRKKIVASPNFKNM